jgi:putative hydrolase of the HAD superfamily
MIFTAADGGCRLVEIMAGRARHWSAMTSKEAAAMVIHAVLFDIGGVLEITPDLGVDRQWEDRLGLPAGALGERLMDIWSGGAVGTITEADVHQALKDRLGLDDGRAEALMADMWREYLGTANTELIEYARRLRPRYRTGIISNSFVGAREREQAMFGVADLADVLIYSHEAGISKPDPHMYGLACSRLDVAPGEAVFVDDTERCVDGARVAGMQAVLYQDNAQVIDDIEELLGAG